MPEDGVAGEHVNVVGQPHELHIADAVPGEEAEEQGLQDRQEDRDSVQEERGNKEDQDGESRSAGEHEEPFGGGPKPPTSRSYLKAAGAFCAMVASIVLMNSDGLMLPCTRSVSSCCSRVFEVGSSWVSHGIAIFDPRSLDWSIAFW